MVKQKTYWAYGLIIGLLFLLILGLWMQKVRIQLIGDNPLVVTMEDTYREMGAKAKILNHDLTNQIKITSHVNMKKAGTYQVEYCVTYFGKVTKKIRSVIVKDTIKPQLKLKGDSSVTLYQNQHYEEAGYQAIDNNDQDLTKKVIVKGKVDTSKVGTYTLTYEVRDQAGNQAQQKRTVIVKKEDPNQKTIYLTFDDGPSPITAHILDILKKNHVKATFFVIHQNDQYNHSLKRMAAEGHTIALHSNTHNYRYIYSSVDIYFKDLYAIQKKVEQVTGVHTTILRFPGGSSNTVSRFNPGIMSRLVTEVEKRGFHYFDWNVGSEDTGRIGSNAIVENVTANLTNKTNVVLMHDYALNQQTADALDQIIQYGKSHGYRFDRITEETPSIHHGVNN